MNTLNQSSAPLAAAFAQRFLALVAQRIAALRKGLANWRSRPADDILWDDGEPEPRR